MLARRLAESVGSDTRDDDRLRAEEEELRAYECDGLTAYRQLPMIVVLPETVAQVSAIMALAGEMNVKIVPRGAGTGLSGGALPLADAVTVGLGKFKKIIDYCVVAIYARAF